MKNLYKPLKHFVAKRVGADAIGLKLEEVAGKGNAPEFGFENLTRSTVRAFGPIKGIHILEDALGAVEKIHSRKEPSRDGLPKEQEIQDLLSQIESQARAVDSRRVHKTYGLTVIRQTLRRATEPALPHHAHRPQGIKTAPASRKPRPW